AGFARRRLGDAGRLGADRRPGGARRADPERLVVLPARHHLCRHHLHRADRAPDGPGIARGEPPPGRLAGPDRMNDVRIRFDHVSVSSQTARGPLRVVDDVSFDVADREFVSIIGPSGCGKTTMMNIVAGFVQPNSGTVLLDGKPIAGPGPERGVIFQEYGVFPWLTVEDNIAFGLRLAANRR